MTAGAATRSELALAGGRRLIIDAPFVDVTAAVRRAWRDGREMVLPLIDGRQAIKVDPASVLAVHERRAWHGRIA